MLLLTLLAAAQAQAVDCDNALSQLAMTQCAAQAFAKADGVLNAEYRKTIAAMRKADAGVDSRLPSDTRPGYAAALVEAQRAWIAFRDAHCRLVGYQMRGGSGEPMLVWQCKETLTRARIKQLIDLR